MKRLGIFGLLTFVLCLGITSQAFGKTEKLKGTLAGGGSIEVDVSLKPVKVHKKTKFVVNKVTAIKATGIPFTCTDGSTGTSDLTFSSVQKTKGLEYGQVLAPPVPAQATPGGSVDGKFATKFGARFTGTVGVGFLKVGSPPNQCRGSVDFSAK